MLQQLANHSAAAVAAPSPSMFVDLPYAPALLLDGRFDVSIVDAPEFRRSCASGYEAYFEGMYESSSVGGGFVERFYTSHEVVREVRDNLLLESPCLEQPSLAWRVGFSLGWLSALALVQRDTALEGLALLWLLVEHEQLMMGRPALTQLSFAA